MSTQYVLDRTGKLKFKKDIKPNSKQIKFFKSTKRYRAYGGARGGGKSWAARVLASTLSVRYRRLKVLILRKTFAELEMNHILPLIAELEGVAVYKASKKMFVFNNGSIIRLGYCKSDLEVGQYQGQEYDVILFEEATSFTEYMLRTIGSCLRTTRTDFKPFIGYFCNPGGPSHHYVKRVFIDRRFEGNEKPEDYEFTQALVYDNQVLMENNPEYIDQLKNMPESMIEAHLNGDWNALSGAFFKEFREEIHVVDPFVIPSDWYIYYVQDYGLDCLAGYWIADNHNGQFYVTKELWQKDLIVSEAAKRILEVTGNDRVAYWYAPPDMKKRSQDTGKDALDLFRENGVNLITTKNDRIEGWLCMKELMKVYEAKNPITGEVYKTANLKFFRNCVKVIEHLQVVQADEKNPNDMSEEPHELSHAPNAIRYFSSEYSKPYYKQEKEISGTWTRGELRMNGYSDAQINFFVEKGYIRLIGR